jgi:hypothetical protein
MSELAHGGIMKWKVGHAHISNNIPQMRSNGFQAPFIAGGNQVGYYLGVRGNNITSLPCSSCISPAFEVIRKNKRK